LLCRSARATVVSVGFAAADVGKTLPSATTRFGTSCAIPLIHNSGIGIDTHTCNATLWGAGYGGAQKHLTDRIVMKPILTRAFAA
jgi:hypothetical protein